LSETTHVYVGYCQACHQITTVVPERFGERRALRRAIADIQGDSGYVQRHRLATGAPWLADPGNWCQCRWRRQEVSVC
jgi:hypothetical protein